MVVSGRWTVKVAPVGVESVTVTLAAVGGDQGGDDREAEAGAAGGAGAGRVGAVEALEDLGLLLIASGPGRCH